MQQETLTTPVLVPTDFNVVRVLFDLSKTPLEQVFDYFTQADRLLEWWPHEAETDPRQDGGYHVSWSKLNLHLRGRYLVFEPGKTLNFTWNWDHEPDNPERTVSIVFLAHGGGTRLTLEHGVYAEGDDEERQSHIDGWLHYLGKLGEALNK